MRWIFDTNIFAVGDAGLLSKYNLALSIDAEYADVAKLHGRFK